ncbi:MAG: flagellar hook-associated protein 3 [Spirochaetaceae bacterium]|jgi:flagellar hook-associated protein 3 FlgL|nr:flagellar hook-associated protein 3 [Spirochaetaceae bacterium]
MRRISTDMPNDDIQFYMRRQEESLANIQSKIAEQTRIRELRDDPLAASHAVRYESYLARLERFEKNTLYAKDHYNYTDTYLRQANDALQRVREIAVQGANGIYTAEDMKYMAVEVNELLKEMVSLANALGPDGRQLFGGDKAFTEPFRAVEGMVEGGGEPMVVRVEYRGAGAHRKAEITDGVYTALDISGGEAFWAEKMQIFSSQDVSNYRVAEESSFFVGGEEIFAAPGDSAQAIAAKINDSGAPVKAAIDPVTNAFTLEGTNPHFIRLEDAENSQVLQDLGLIIPNADAGAPNWNPSARVSGGSAFDMMIRLRDSLFRGDYDFIGAQGLGGIDLALTNVQTRLADIGSRQERAEKTWQRLNEEIPNVTANLSRESSLNFATAATDLGMIEFAHKATLQTAAKILPQTLLDFLR